MIMAIQHHPYLLWRKLLMGVYGQVSQIKLPVYKKNDLKH